MGRVALDKFMEGSYKKHKEHPSVKCFPIPASIDRSRKAYTALKDMQTEVNSWAPPLDFKEARSKVFSLASEFFSAVEDTMSYQDCLSTTKQTVTTEKESSKRRWRNHRQLFVALYQVRSEHYPVVAKVCGDLSFSVYEPPSKIGIQTCVYVCLPLETTDSSSVDVFSVPRLVLPETDVPVLDRTFWHTQCYIFLSENLATIQAKSTASLPTLRASTASAPTNVAKGLIEPKNFFKWNGPEKEFPQWFDCVPDVKVPVFTHSVGHAWLATQDFPYAGIPGFLHAIFGSLVVMVITAASMLEHPNPSAFLKSLPTTGWEKEHAVILRPGGSLFIPFGCVPVVIGMPAHCHDVDENNCPKERDEQAATELETVTWAMTLLYDKSAFTQSANVQLLVASQAALAYPYTFKFFKTSEPIKKWVQDLSQSQTAGVPVED